MYTVTNERAAPENPARRRTPGNAIMTRVEIDGISKSYQRGVPVLKPIRLTIEPGELFFLLGPSGCG
mgnify:FL=1